MGRSSNPSILTLVMLPGALLVAVAILATSGCMFSFPNDAVLTEAKSISNFTVDGDALYFGGGRHLYRVLLPTRSIERIHSTKTTTVEQPIVANGIAYFGGRSYVDAAGKRADRDSFYALDLQNGTILWQFPLGVDGYGTYGPYPVLVDDRILVCSRQHLHCLDRKTGRELWKVDNWFGRDSDGITVPYVDNGYVYFKIAEEDFVGSRSNDGHWAKVVLANGRRASVLRVAEHPGTYEYGSGHAIGVLTDDVVYGATRYNVREPGSHFGALDLENERIIWEVNGSRVRTKPAVSGNLVLVFRDDDSLQALNRQTGSFVWDESIAEIVRTDASTLIRPDKDYEYENSRRIAATKEVVVVQGSQGVMALSANTGKHLWITRLKSEMGDGDPLIVGEVVILSVVNESSIIALDLKNGHQLWRVWVPDCKYHYWLE